MNEKLIKLKTALPGLVAFVMLAAIITYPSESYQSALSGLDIFLQSVFLHCFPFYSIRDNDRTWSS